MANILTQEDDKNKEMQTSAPMQQNDGVQSTGGGPSTTSNPATQAVQAKPQGSGRFTNLQKYLGANKKASDQLTGGIRQKGEDYMGKVREGIQSAQGVQQGIQDERSRIGQAGQLAQGIQNDAVNVAQNNLQDVTQLRLGQNQANQLQGRGQQAISDLSQNINPLQQFGQNLGTESGRFQVLQDTFGGAYKPNYNMGQRRLDQLFLQAGDDRGLNQLSSDIGQTVGSANQNLSSLQKDLGGGIQDIRGGAQQAQRDILGAIGQFNPDAEGAFGTLYGDLTSEQDVRRNELQDNLERARSQFGAGRMSSDVANLLGLGGGTNVGVMDLQDYANRNINLGDTDVTMADVADRADYMDRLNALAALSGTQVGDYDLGVKEGSDIGFDANKFTSDAAKHMQNYEDNVFEQSLHDALGLYNTHTGEMYNPNDYNQGKNEYRENTTINDLMQGYLGSTGSSSGIFRTGGWGGEQAADTTSREQLQNALNYSERMYHPTYRSWYQSDINQFNRLLDYLDSNRNNRMIVDDSVADLESGGNFNVT